jgi:hypothetical protein
VTLAELKRLSGVGQGVYPSTDDPSTSGSNISITGNEKAQMMKKHKIEPGTDAWFRFSLPLLTGEKPIGRSRSK